MSVSNPGTHSRRRPAMGLLAGAVGLPLVLLSGTSPGSANADEPNAQPSSAPDAETMAAGDFASSFEDSDPQPTWADEVETNPDGSTRADGVRGPDPVGIPGDISDHITDITASAENTEGGEVAANAVDGDINSKWLAFEDAGWLQIELDEPIEVVRYALTSADDAGERDPREWTLQGSTDGETWTTVDGRTEQSWEQRFETREFEVTDPDAFDHYRLDITANQSGDLLQLAEWQLSDGSEPPPPLPNMASHPDDGPSTTYASASDVGFTGVRAFEYAGKVTEDDGGYSTNKVFDVDVPVGPDTELSYRIFPAFIEGDLTYPSTTAAVDLAFTDGTYLSELAATDQHGFKLSPRGQGASKSLYTNQWNHKESVIGEVAAGKTIDRILLAYDAPNGPADFRGWVDDIAITAESATPNPDPNSGADSSAADSAADYVDTTRGTHSSGTFSRGNTIPATAVPHGFNFWAPVTDAGSLTWFYNYHADNNEQNRPELQALQLTHETSPWMGDRQTFQVMPSSASATPDPDREARALPFSHDNETASAHYYGVTFDDGMQAEITPTDHAAMFRFSFPGDDANLIFDNVSNDGGLTLDAETGELTGYTDTRSGLSNGATRMYVYATFDQAVVDGGTLPAEDRADVAGYYRFDAGEDQRVTMRIATSLISVDQGATQPRPGDRRRRHLRRRPRPCSPAVGGQARHPRGRGSLA